MKDNRDIFNCCQQYPKPFRLREIERRAYMLLAKKSIAKESRKQLF